MNKKTLHARAATLAAAMESIQEQTPPGWFVLSTEETRPLAHTVRETADSVEEAREQARKRILLQAQNQQEKVIREPLRKTETVSAFTEDEARSGVSGINDEGIQITKVDMVAKGSRGFLGIGKKPDQYEVELFYPAIVEITYENLAEVTAEITNDRQAANEHFLEYAEKGYLDLVKKFLELGADINAVNHNGASALILAAFNGHVKLCDYLIEQGIDINRTDQGGFTALMVACEAAKASADLVKTLVDKGADVNARSGRGSTALMAAAKIGHAEIVSLLLAKGAEINARNTDHNVTPLIWAANGGHVSIVKYLLAKGADAGIVTHNGYTAASIAQENGHHYVVEAINRHLSS